MPEREYTKAEHDRDHKTLLLEGCRWCDWEFQDMENATLGRGGERY